MNLFFGFFLEIFLRFCPNEHSFLYINISEITTNLPPPLGEIDYFSYFVSASIISWIPLKNPES